MNNQRRATFKILHSTQRAAGRDSSHTVNRAKMEHEVVTTLVDDTAELTDQRLQPKRSLKLNTTNRRIIKKHHNINKELEENSKKLAKVDDLFMD